jgi:small subunit ribosomal protein S15
MLISRKKQRIIKDYQAHEKDTGSGEIQIALLTKKIGELIEHLKQHPKDNHSRRGLLKMVGKRKKFLDYLKKTDPRSYSALVRKLGLKK